MVLFDILQLPRTVILHSEKLTHPIVFLFFFGGPVSSLLRFYCIFHYSIHFTLEWWPIQIPIVHSRHIQLCKEKSLELSSRQAISYLGIIIFTFGTFVYLIYRYVTTNFSYKIESKRSRRRYYSYLCIIITHFEEEKKFVFVIFF